ncbi:Sulfotransferase domain [Dillenia turbinata]|uniref:Sulfotransferase n=1 Tax=Dillenia turbinata TaxID=194707 RepID=A0AAN8V065_9MAGN
MELAPDSEKISIPKIFENELEDESERAQNCYDEKFSNLPSDSRWRSIYNYYQYQDFWLYPHHLEGLISAQEHFIAKPTDIIISSGPKCGTTWLKALTFTIVTRSYFNCSNSPLLTTLSHGCIPFLEGKKSLKPPSTPGLILPLLATHVPFDSLPKSILSSSCKIVYICREPKDVFVSLWYHTRKLVQRGKAALELEEAFELFCQGVSIYGPYWDHVLSYWKASMKWPQRILFLKYEELMRDTFSYVKKLAEFIGYPFSSNEEKEGAIQKIINFCSFESIRNFEVNKSGKHYICGPSNLVENSILYRKAEVGDWKNHLTPEMAERIDKITEQKLGHFALKFGVATENSEGN